MNWVHLTPKDGAKVVIVNLHRVFAMMPLESGGTRLWSGDIAAVPQPRVKTGDPSFISLPLQIDVTEDPEEIFRAGGVRS